MATYKTFKVFGELVEILVTGQTSNGILAVLTQTSPPGGGPPPHCHTNEDETFTVLEGEFEIFDGTSWHPLSPGAVHFGRRGKTHTFRNSGSKTGKILVFVTPSGMENFLEEISPLSLPGDMRAFQAICERFGVTINLPGGDGA